jgi:hypothetical protein
MSIYVQKHLICELWLKQLVVCSIYLSMRLNALLDTPHPLPPHPFKDGGAVADSLPGIHSAMVKCLFIVNRSCIQYKRYQLSAEDSDMVWRPRSGSCSVYPSVMIAVTENTPLGRASM